jgi:hypothetical protein
MIDTYSAHSDSVISTGPVVGVAICAPFSMRSCAITRPDDSVISGVTFAVLVIFIAPNVGRLAPAGLIRF